jgi:ssDNA-binding Zn-finger/Zn-ribbon topoisomerase 1
MSSTVKVTCPKCNETISKPAEDTKIVQSFVLCAKCNNLFKVA